MLMFWRNRLFSGLKVRAAPIRGDSSFRHSRVCPHPTPTNCFATANPPPPPAAAAAAFPTTTSRVNNPL